MIDEDYADALLEKLIDIFKKLSDNDTLVSELRNFKEKRNFLSHKGITHCLDYDDELDYGSMSEFQSQLAAIPAEAQRLRQAVTKRRISSVGTCGSMMNRIRANPSIERTALWRKRIFRVSPKPQRDDLSLSKAYR
jgi:hypothetical protein